MARRLARGGRAAFAAAGLGAAAAAQQFFQPCERDHFEPDPGAVVAVLPVDVDGDGSIDLLLRDDAGVQSWYRNDGHGAFLRQPLALAADLRAAPAVADVDGDGDADLLLGGVLQRNQGGGTFVADGAALPAAAAGCDLPVFVDLDGGGGADLVARAAGPARELRVFRNDGTGRFADVTAAVLPAPQPQTTALAATDADRDGDRDLLVASATATGQLLRNDGAGHFQAVPVPVIAAGTPQLSAGDVDLDGDDDLLAGGALSINDGLGGFTAAAIQAFAAPLVPLGPFQRAILVDLDQDGRADLADLDTSNGYFRNEGPVGPATFRFFEVWFPPWLFGAAPLTFVDLDGDLDLDAVGPGARPRLLFGSAGGFHDGVQQTVLMPPRAQPLHAADARVDAGPSPFVEIGLVDGGRAVLLSNRFPPVQPPIPGACAPLFAPAVPNCTAVALCDLTGRRDHSLVACTPQGARLLLRVFVDTLVDGTARLHPLGTPVAVACGNLSGDGADEIVFGAAGIDGPQILTPDPAGQLQPTLPALPPPPAPGHPLHEAVLLADFDGDGDLDILHELRIVRNDGGNTWSAGPVIAGLVPADALGMVALDHDGDGLADLLVWSAATPVRLLRNLGGSFADATMGRIPAAIGLPAALSVGDVDGDGDPDLLADGGGRAALLRNDGGVFVRFPDVGPEGVLVDMDQDRDADLFDGVRIHHGLFCQLNAPRLPTLGADYRLDVRTWRAGAPAALAFVAVSAQPGYLVTPQVAIVRVDPLAAVAVPLLLAGGEGSVAAPLPRTPLLLGATFVVQALVFDGTGPIRGSNDLRETVR